MSVEDRITLFLFLGLVGSFLIMGLLWWLLGKFTSLNKGTVARISFAFSMSLSITFTNWMLDFSMSISSFIFAVVLVGATTYYVGQYVQKMEAIKRKEPR